MVKVNPFQSTEKTSVSNWSRTELTFQEQRSLLLEKSTAAEVAGAPFVFADRQLLTTALTRIQLFEKILSVQGAIVECGVYRANSSMLYYHLSTILEPYNFNRQIIGFDTFEGFRSLTNKDDSRLTKNDYAQTDYQRILDWSKLHDSNRAIGHVQKPQLIKGDATETIPEYVEKNPHLIVALLYIDFDIYAPTSTAIKHLVPLVPKGGIIGFDELNSKKWASETIALKENMKLHDLRLQKFYYDPWVSFYFVE